MPHIPLRPNFFLRRRYLPFPFLLQPKFIHEHSFPSSELDLSNPTFMIYGSNTGVGKTLVSTGIATSILSGSEPSHCLYIKPVQTGFPVDSDSRFVYRKVSEILRTGKPRGIFASNRVVKASKEVLNAATELSMDNIEEGLGFRGSCCYEETVVGKGMEEGKGFKLICLTLYGWKEAVSPHLAVEREGMAVDDSLLREELGSWLRVSVGGEKDGGDEKGAVWRLVETAGGVASPGPSGSLQCDLYRPFRLPVILVGDGRLGGISATISAYESLEVRGYDTVAIVLEGLGLQNEISLLSYLRNRLPVFVLPPVPKEPSNNLIDWFSESSKIFSSLQEVMLSYHRKRIQSLHDMRKKASNIFWWPFTQHKFVPMEIVTVIDSRCGENFAIHKVRHNKEMLVSQFDACASWWTQGPDAILQTELAREMGYSAARYGHVMFPENVYEPSFRCAELLLEGVGKGWASRVFFSDNGSTAVEIALKMALRKFSFDHGLTGFENVNSSGIDEIRVLALNGSYHGDTLGAMEAQAPTSYTGFLQHPWYSGKGLFLKPPTVLISMEIWNLSIPDCFESDNFGKDDLQFSSYGELLSRDRDSSDVARCYFSYISNQLLEFSASNPNKYIGALIIEPVIHGSGGMHMIDPLFQRMLATECRKRRIPIIFDEVFSGFWRLGRESAAELLDCLPDIACFGKLMTGGIIPLAATLATETVFNAFRGDSKLIALLHGHSYSAHAMGCAAAVKSMQWFKDPTTNINIEHGEGKLKELWDMKFVHHISSLPAVKRVVALGTLFAIEIRAKGADLGYASLQASSLVQQLREDGIFMRPLGNVIYLMCGPCTSQHFCSQQLIKVHQRISKFSEAWVKESQFDQTYGNQIF
ncbi:bifunctional dethiobiotin synthetase/7,8-diamino-pelargonic acid aminotransferase, mitochondrial isoform X1 [Dendrobium catenatum]|uniref:Bifunctional dethiobiotin synthetase/7,8-diamino-pelargonic acid aminotransferase, mitochondrial n=2 Tax=Dendrobium catenatum TaxID=906689 RepID=A0A2I0W5V8_9ASPA|nr:bifunctional dethiobiotin synthetase/7,8-diamino-pelargonic acid aminotransferase, mitochondrial isoform X1 [Dendrobium catenatum]XP_028554211.1 bifunctional dethiobiotin synthetase/7,8-diamino-pelargonic acid aminotransferase, mitochondrial isoform X1 [Dendrobium catenatum]PKU71047.1 Bifunctional dethiobiotin synthetase/7,8-diamino-pelargonic acid aminotransferase, mitochondrial [Dendrobium catenatum]